MLNINFNTNRKKITFLEILICLLSKFKNQIVNIEITHHIQKIISNGVQEGDEYCLDGVRYYCLKNRKNLVLKIIFSENKEYIIKVYAYSNSWFNEGVLLKALVKKNMRKKFPLAIEFGYFKINTPLYRKVLLYNVFPFYEGITYQDSCITEDEKNSFFKELGIYYLKMEHLLNDKIWVRIMNSLRHYQFGENMYNLSAANKKYIKKLQKETNNIARKYHLKDTIIIQNDIYEYNVLIDPLTHKISCVIDYEFICHGNKLVTLYYLMYDYFENDSLKVSRECIISFCEGYEIPIESFYELIELFCKWKVVFDTCISNPVNMQCDNSYYYFAKK